VLFILKQRRTPENLYSRTKALLVKEGLLKEEALPEEILSACKELMETSQYSIGGFSNLGWQLYMGRIKSLLFNICWIALIFLPSSREVKDNIQLPSKR